MVDKSKGPQLENQPLRKKLLRVHRDVQIYGQDLYQVKSHRNRVILGAFHLFAYLNEFSEQVNFHRKSLN